MSLFKNKYKIQSNRLQNWDYSSEGIYFITLATYNRENIFGSIDSDLMILNHNGKIIENEIIKSIKIRDNWIFHNWIVMPNHIHLLIEIEYNNIQTIDTQSTNIQHVNPQPVETHRSGSTSSISNNTETNITKTHCGASLQNQNDNQSLSKPFRKPNSISSFIAIFKSVTTKQIITLNDIDGVDVLRYVSTSAPIGKTFDSGTPIWQSNYHDHIVLNYVSFEKIDSYITNNPKNWNSDSINISNINTSI